jgi:hypothetical protein
MAEDDESSDGLATTLKNIAAESIASCADNSIDQNLKIDGDTGKNKNGHIEPQDKYKHEEGEGIAEEGEKDKERNKEEEQEEEQEEGEEAKAEVEAEAEAEAEEEEDEEEEEEEEEEPPLLKYTRPSQLPKNLFDKDPVSKCLFHEKYFIFATHSGLVHICKPDFLIVKTIKAHKASVLSIFADDTNFATGSMDGTVAIGSFKGNEVKSYDFQRPIHCVALAKNYEKNYTFLSGGMSGKVILSTITWFGKKNDFVLDEENGPIVALDIIDDVTFWMNDKGINFYNISARRMIKVIEKPPGSPRSDLYWPRISYPEVDRILIAWGNHIWSLRVSLKAKDDKNVSASGVSKILPSTSLISFRVIQDKEIEVEHIFQLESLISGIVTFKDDLWMIMTYEPPQLDEETGERNYFNPDLKLFNSAKGEVVMEEEIGLKNSNTLGLNDFMLGCYYGTITSYFIVSARDFVIAQEFQIQDQLSWFISHDKYYEAWEMSKHLVTPIKRLNFGVQYVDNLVKDEEWDKALSFLKTLLHIDDAELPEADGKSTIATTRSDDRETYINEVVSLWDTWANICIKTNHIPQLTEIIPTNPKLNIPKAIYNEILEYWLQNDANRFFELADNWKTDLFDIKIIEATLEAMLEEDFENKSLRRSLTKLYEKSFEPAKAVPHLMKLQDKNLISYISEHHIFMKFVDKIPAMIELKFKSDEISTLPIELINPRIDTDVKIIVNHRQEFLPDQVLKLFHQANLECMNFFYLENLLEIDEFMASNFINERINLYCQYDRRKLLPILTKANNYDIDLTIKLCEENQFIEELVYLLGKIGENLRALDLITKELNDPIKAINFAKRQNDKELWKQLLDYSMDKPNFINALIENADDQSNIYYDPITILKKLPLNIRVKGLTESVIKFSSNNDLNLILNQLMLIIVHQQSEQSSIKYRLEKLKGFEIDITRLNHLIENFETLLICKFGEEYKIRPNEDKLVSQSFKSMELKLKILRKVIQDSNNH